MEACINEYGRALYSFCSYLACNRQEAEDLYQDTFLKALELGGQIDGEQNFHRIAHLEKPKAEICLEKADRGYTANG